MLLLFVFNLLALRAHGFITDNADTESNDIFRERVKRILYGTPIKGGIWKSYALIESRYRVNVFLMNMHQCGGSLVSPNQLVTAAHCFPKEKKNWVSTIVKLGYNGRTYTAVRKATTVSMVDGSTKYDDFAILTLKTPIVETTLISPVELSSKEPNTKSECIAVGSGNNENDQDMRLHPQQAALSILSPENCCHATKEHQFCAGDSQKGLNDGDSGGPLYCKESNVWKLYGIAKGSGHGCFNKVISTYSKVSFYKSFLQKALAKKNGVFIMQKS